MQIIEGQEAYIKCTKHNLAGKKQGTNSDEPI
jgi:hypothetical protein